MTTNKEINLVPILKIVSARTEEIVNNARHNLNFFLLLIDISDNYMHKLNAAKLKLKLAKGICCYCTFIK